MDEDDDVLSTEPEIDAFEDHVAQRAIAFCHVARLTMEAKLDDEVRAVCLTMLKKLPNSIKAPSTADLKAFGR